MTMKWEIDPAFQTAANAGVLAFLVERSPSAHSDLAEELRLAAQGAPGAQLYCPAPAEYAFFAVHRADRTIVALALGMSRIVFRLPETLAAEALNDGGSRVSEIGPGWVAFAPFSNDEPQVVSRQRLGRWCRQALLGGVEDR